MWNWSQIVRERLRTAGLSFSDSIIAELSAHLEESYEAAQTGGKSEAQAFALALQEIPDGRVLAREIHHAQSREGRMNYRTRSLWLPALVTFLGASVSLMLCQLLGMQPHIVWFERLAVSFYIPWLATLPLFGAAGAWLSRRAQGSMSMRFAAGISPGLIILIVMLLPLPWGLALDGLHFLQLVSFGLALITWVLIPAMALSLGVLPFLKPCA